VLTDLAPFDYLYLSRRLLTDLFQHEEAARSKWRGTFDLNVPFLGLHLQRRGPDPNNLRDLAMRSEAIVADQTGDVSHPGYFIVGEFDAHHGVFEPHMGWRGGEVACYRVETTTATDERVMVALFGSASNVIGRRRADEQSEFYPSDATGLYSLLDAARERDDPEVDLDYRWDDATMSNEARADTAIMFSREGATRRLGTVRFLARVFQVIDSSEFRDESVDRVIIGAPLWVATPEPRPFTCDA
jgi:hypothetical protein